MKNNKSALRPHCVFVYFTITLLLFALGVVGVVDPTTSSAAPAGGLNASGPMAFCTTDPVVANNLDAGAGSLRQAIIDACDGSTITFDMTTVTSPISLTTAELTLEKNLTITGPGSTSLTIARSAAGGTPQFRIFNIPFSFLTVNISGLTVTNGRGADGVPIGDIGGDGDAGGGIRNFGALTLSDVRIIGNRAGTGGTATRLVGNGGRGGGIYNEGSVLTMTNCVVSGNQSGDGGTGGNGDGGGHAAEGAGIYTRAGTNTLTNVTISNNTGGNATVRGGSGGIAAGMFIGVNSTVASMTSSVVSNNIAGEGTGIDGSPGYTGGIWNEGQLTITNSTISGNVSRNISGGVMNRPLAVLRLTNSTLSENSALGAPAIENDIDGLLILTNCTITNNTSLGLGAVHVNTPTAEVRNTIIAGNFADRDVGGNFISRGNNVIGNSDNSAGFTNGINNDQVGSGVAPLNPRLGPLANNGGPTQTHALLAGSPALDAGNNCVLNNSCPNTLGIFLTTDQRGAGFPRATDSADANTTATVDVGAYEAQLSIEDIANKSTAEDTPLSFNFNISDASATVTVTSSNVAVVPNDPANLSVTGSGLTRILNIAPGANQSGLAIITVTVSNATESMSDTFVLTVITVADTPSVTSATTFVNTQTTTGLVITRNAVDGAEITHFKITNITNGPLFKNNGTTQIANNEFITSAEANAGLRFTPASNLSSPATTFSFQVQGATNASGAGVGPVATASITVNKRTPTVALASSVNPSDFGQSVTFTATVSSGSGTPTGTVQFKDGGSNLGSAQTLTNGTAQLTTAALASGNHVITVDYSGDSVFESGSGTLSGGQTVKAAPTISINDVSVAEGNSGATNLSFTVTLSAASAATVSVAYATADGTALTSDNDYQSTSGTLTFNPGDLTKPITVVINGDQKTELDETVLLNLTNPLNAVVADAQGVGTIQNDDLLQLLLEEGGPTANQATALDSVWFVRDPFSIPGLVPQFDPGADHNKRVILFAANLTLNPGDTSAAATITLVDGNSQTFTVSAEDVRAVPNTSFSQVVFRLPDNIAPGICLVTLNLHGQISNTGAIRIAQ